MVSHRRIRSCGLCGETLTDKNRTREHIIANAIGGVKTTSSFICEQCNQKTGDEWDVSLAKELHHLTLLVGIKRDRGRVPATQVEATDGRQLVYRANGEMELVGSPVRVIDADGKRTFEIRSRSHSGLARILQSLKRKHPGLDVDAAISQAEYLVNTDRHTAKLTVSLSNPASRRALVKSMVCLAVDQGIDIAACDAALAYLRGDEDDLRQGFVYTLDPITARQDRSVFHCVAVFTPPGSSLLLGYVELYSMYRVVAVLSEKYQGPSFKPVSYAINPLEGLPIKVGFDGSLLSIDPQRLEEGAYDTETSMQLVLDRMIPVVARRAKQREFDAAFTNYFHTAMGAAGLRYGDIIDGRKGEMFIGVLSRLIAEHVMLHGWHGPTKT